MRENVQVKICGLSTAQALQTAIENGADFVGFVFYPPSPRHIPLEQAAGLRRIVPPHVKTVLVTVNPDDALLDAASALLQPDFIQLHGNEPPARVEAIRQRVDFGIIKALAVSQKEDIQSANAYLPSIDMLMFDAKPSPASALPGGNGLAFDWSLLAGQRFLLPWALSGGLNPGNVAQAFAITGAPMVDVSSGVESSPGQKDCRLIAEFIHRCKTSRS